MIDNYQNLANAIVLSAVKDYKKALRTASRYPRNRAAKYEVKRIEKFFRSDYYKVLTGIDAEMLISRIKAEISDKEEAI